jgi:hypothetical protein
VRKAKTEIRIKNLFSINIPTNIREYFTTFRPCATRGFDKNQTLLHRKIKTI